MNSFTCTEHSEEFVYDPDEETQALGEWEDHWICPVPGCGQGTWAG